MYICVSTVSSLCFLFLLLPRAAAAPPPSNALNFKRFRKNAVQVCNSREIVDRGHLIVVLPKESEMEVQFRNDEAMEYAMHQEGERLFDEDDDPGPKRRRKK